MTPAMAKTSRKVESSNELRQDMLPQIRRIYRAYAVDILIYRKGLATNLVLAGGRRSV